MSGGDGDDGQGGSGAASGPGLRATRAVLDTRRARLLDGEGHLGWKVAFGAPTWLESLGVGRPLVGFLTERRRLESGASVAIGGWTRPVLEAEVGAWLARDLGADVTAEEALGAVRGWSVAIELADLDVTPSPDLDAFVPGNIFHRRVVLGPEQPELPGDLHAVVARDGEQVAATSTPPGPFALTGEPGPVLASVADLVARAGSGMSAGDVVILGSLVPPVAVTAGLWSVTMPGLGTLDVDLTA